ncbi:flagellar biosynthetic protein FliR [Oxalobacter sp. OttesenSCG-928-P03]|nr:flagellar biosynthetic protein FliR [Oxalobacter sp. OttesenSCG-928-P03]
MVIFNSNDLLIWVSSFIWPLTRILGLMAGAPLFSSSGIPVRFRVLLGVFIALVISPAVPVELAVDPMSYTGFLILVQQFLIGAAMGLAMRFAFSALEMAGAAVGMTMGLGFAMFYDPQTRGQSPAISQYFSLLILTLYVAANFHLLMLSVVVESFTTLPIAGAPMGRDGFFLIIKWGGMIFSYGLQLALPILAALLITNVSLGILTRAAPQLNLFGIGFPVTIATGFVMIALMLSYMAVPMEDLFREVFGLIRQLGSAELFPH